MRPETIRQQEFNDRLKLQLTAVHDLKKWASVCVCRLIESWLISILQRLSWAENINKDPVTPVIACFNGGKSQSVVV